MRLRRLLPLLLLAVVHPAAGQSVSLTVDPTGKYFATYRSASGGTVSSRAITVSSDSTACVIAPDAGKNGRYGSILPNVTLTGPARKCSVIARASVSGVTYASPVAWAEVYPVTGYAVRSIAAPVPPPVPPPPVPPPPPPVPPPAPPPPPPPPVALPGSPSIGVPVMVDRGATVDVTFTWSAASGATSYQWWAAYYSSPSVWASRGDTTSGRSVTVTGIPKANGAYWEVCVWGVNSAGANEAGKSCNGVMVPAGSAPPAPPAPSGPPAPVLSLGSQVEEDVSAAGWPAGYTKHRWTRLITVGNAQPGDSISDGRGTSLLVGSVIGAAIERRIPATDSTVSVSIKFWRAGVWGPATAISWRIP